MSFAPKKFTRTEKDTLADLLEKSGYSDKIEPEVRGRYSFIDDEIITLDYKRPLRFGFRLNIPFEITAFHHSFSIRPRIINSESMEQIGFLAVNLKHIVDGIELQQSFPIADKKYDLVELLNEFMPEIFNGESERQWISRIRLSILNSFKDLFAEYEKEFLEKTVEGLKTAGLFPTWKYPPSLSKGLPARHRYNTLFFGNSEGNEYFIIERGFITFIRDAEFNRVKLRCMFESYTPLVMETLFADKEDFSVTSAIIGWIRYIRTAAGMLLGLLSDEYIDTSVLFPIKDEYIYKYSSSDSCLPLPAIAREILAKDDLYPPRKDLLIHPPVDFEELEGVSAFDNAVKIVSEGRIDKAIPEFKKLLILFNKYRQKLGVVRVLIKLAEIAADLLQYNKGISYLKNALEVCKDGTVPVEVIMEIHEKMGNIYTWAGDNIEAVKHYGIIEGFLSAEDPEKHSLKIIRIKLLIAENLVKSGKLKDAANILASVQKVLKNLPPDLQLRFYYTRFVFFTAQRKIASAGQTLRKACQLENVKDDLLRAECFYELGWLLLYKRKLPEKAQGLLVAAEKILEKPEPGTRTLLLKLKIYETLADAFNKTGDREEMKFYMERARQTRQLLRVRGIM